MSVTPSPEQSMVTARASVMLYDDSTKKWSTVGASHGTPASANLSKLHIYFNGSVGTYRVVGRKVSDHDVVLNCPITRTVRYNQATPTFHQWKDNKQVYGLNFASREDADSFANAMLNAVEHLTSLHRSKQSLAQVAPPSSTSSNSQTPSNPSLNSVGSGVSNSLHTPQPSNGKPGAGPGVGPGVSSAVRIQTVAQTHPIPPNLTSALDAALSQPQSQSQSRPPSQPPHGVNGPSASSSPPAVHLNNCFDYSQQLSGMVNTCILNCVHCICIFMAWSSQIENKLAIIIMYVLE